jgi:hypothetical protein
MRLIAYGENPSDYNDLKSRLTSLLLICAVWQIREGVGGIRKAAASAMADS